MIKLYTPEDHRGIPTQMVSPNDATEDDDLYVEYADYRLLEKDRDDLLARIRNTVYLVAGSAPGKPFTCCDGIGHHNMGCVYQGDDNEEAFDRRPMDEGKGSPLAKGTAK